MSRLHLKNTAEFEEFCMAVAGTGSALHVQVLHDDGCTPGVCSCDPEYVVEDLTPDSYLAGRRAQEEWVRNKAP
jgi:hypothetical protein